MGWSLNDLSYFSDLRLLKDWLIDISKEMNEEIKAIKKAGR